MNMTIILTALMALLTGFTAGIALPNEETIQSGEDKLTNPTTETVLAEDFVSIRPGIAALPNEVLSAEETADLVYMREEEKLARDVYQTLYETWGTPIFSNIARSEQTHTEAVRDLLEKYNLADPVMDDTIGIFTNPELQTLYNALVETGNKSKQDALIVGATIEDLDIKDLQEALKRTNNSDIKLVYENLKRASNNHLRAFTRQLTQLGTTYDPQYISTEEYANIINSSNETGSGPQAGGGRGWGKGN